MRLYACSLLGFNGDKVHVCSQGVMVDGEDDIQVLCEDMARSIFTTKQGFTAWHVNVTEMMLHYNFVIGSDSYRIVLEKQTGK